MAYFNKLPQMLYNFPIGGSEKMVIVRDITANVRVVKAVLDSITLYDEYDVIDGETPEIVSEKVYGSPEYHWAVMIANLRFDYINDWLLPYDRLVEYCKDKYGETGLNEIHHYEDENGYVVNDDYPLATPIDNITYEERINESKRRIKIVSKTLLQQMVNDFDKIMNPNGVI
jgi:hypothetical protein